MATKFYLTQNMKYPTPVVAGKDIQFFPAVFMQGTGSEWGTYSTDISEEQEAIEKFPHLQEISEEDFRSYEKQRQHRQDYSTVFHTYHRGIAADLKSSAVAVVVDEPVVQEPTRQESLEEILTARVTPSKKK